MHVCAVGDGGRESPVTLLLQRAGRHRLTQETENDVVSICLTAPEVTSRNANKKPYKYIGIEWLGLPNPHAS